MQETLPADGMQTPSGMETPSGLASVVSTVPGGLETPDFLELRKNAGRAQSEADSGPRSLYQVVPERQTAVRGLMGSERGYDISGVAGSQQVPVLGEERGSKVSSQCLDLSVPTNLEVQRKGNGIEVSIDATELENMSDDQLRRRYEAATKGSAGVPGSTGGEDFSDMIAKEMATRQKKQKMQENKRGGSSKEFKF